MAKGQSKVTKISDDDEAGTAKPNEVEKSEAAKSGAGASKTTEENAANLVEETGADKEFVSDAALLRAVTLLPVVEESDGKKGIGKVKGLPKEEGEVIDRAVRGSGKQKYEVVVTENFRKFVKAL